ncbi:MAG: Lrp/AsnC family transcriptional regulator [Pseudomonadales bacterium]|nr:Lrp/AsnC family transcriptional regulator [Pseudomonadales bacterium]
MKLESAEKAILQSLQINGRMPNVELAEAIGLSESPCFRRVKQLEQAGIIAGYSARVDRKKIGLEVTAFVLVSLERQPDTATEAFLAAVEAEPYIVECFAVSGSHDYLMKVVAQNLDHFSDLCMKQILRFPGVNHVESTLALKVIKESHAFPVPDQ